MSKHTPGPWVVDYGSTKGHIKSTATREDGRTPTVARYDLHAMCSIDGDEAKANARLIAAAPELLDACVAAIEATGGSHLWNGWTRKFLVMAENALRNVGIDPATIEAKNTIGPEDSSEEGV